jgi:mRNA interferase MazF
MQESDIALAAIPQADGLTKVRPVLLLRQMPGRGDYLVCGISTQLHEEVKGFDAVLTASDASFAQSGLLHPSLIRLGFLAVVPSTKIAGTIGCLTVECHHRLLRRLSDHLLQTIV